MREIRVWREPYDEGYNTTSARQIRFEEGVTIPKITRHLAETDHENAD